MATLREEMLEYARPFYAVANEYANTMSLLTGKVWAAKVPAIGIDGYPSLHFKLIEAESGMTLYIGGDRHSDRVTCSPFMPSIPDGTAHPRYSIWRDFGLGVQPEAGVSLERFLNNTPACSRRFHKMVVMPMAEAWPKVTKLIEDYREGYAKRDEVATELAAMFNGTVRTDGSKVSVHLPGSLPWFTVDIGGRIRFGHTHTLSLLAVVALCGAMSNEQKVG